MADLGQLMRIAPITGAGMMGQQFAQEQGNAQLEQQRLAEVIRAAQQKYQQEADMHPLEKAYKQAQPQNTLALAGHSNAQTEGLTLGNALTRATQPNAIAATNAKNEGEVFTQGINRGNQMRDQFLNGATMPGATVAAIRADLAAKGINPDHPSLQPMWGQVSAMDPKQLNKFAADMSTKLGQTAANRDPHYLGEVYRADSSKASHIEGARIAAGATIQAANIRAMEAKHRLEERLKKEKGIAELSPEGRIAKFRDLAHQATDEMEKQRYLWEAAREEALILTKGGKATQPVPQKGATETTPTGGGQQNPYEGASPAAGAASAAQVAPPMAVGPQRLPDGSTVIIRPKKTQ